MYVSIMSISNRSCVLCRKIHLYKNYFLFLFSKDKILQIVSSENGAKTHDHLNSKWRKGSSDEMKLWNEIRIKLLSRIKVLAIFLSKIFSIYEDFWTLFSCLKSHLVWPVYWRYSSPWHWSRTWPDQPGSERCCQLGLPRLERINYNHNDK